MEQRTPTERLFQEVPGYSQKLIWEENGFLESPFDLKYKDDDPAL